jgi:CRISPR/Cas system-associated exonuclease Cas4 (RecB family)
MIQALLGGPQVDVSKYTGEEIESAENALIKFKAWLIEHEMETQAIELQLVSERYKVGGTIDWYGTLDGAYTLVDLKTSGRVYDEHIIQVAAYARLMEESSYEIDRVRILRFSREDDSSQRDMTLSEEQLRVGWEIFKHLRDIYDLKQNIKVA